MPNRTTFFIIAGVAALLTVLQLRVAIHEQLWREFFLSSFQVLLCAASASLLLRTKE